MDNICALATAMGGAIALIRVSGDDAIKITDSIFTCDISEAQGRTLHYGRILDTEGNTIDDVIVSVYRAPHSYTGENSTEISCHASTYIVKSILETLIKSGCRQAQPGEYTMRAYMNGKMDLSQAEAVADLIASTNKATHQLALGQLRGNFSSELSSLRDKLLKMTSLLELEMDFSDQDVEFANRQELLTLAETIDSRIKSLMDSFNTGNAIKKGIPVAIIGKTNVGKSTLLNRIIGDDKAIVSDVHGTTRDVIEDTINIHGVTFRFIDTAGIRDTQDTVEKIGIERTYKKIDEASIIIWLIDELPSDTEINDIIQKTTDKKLIVVENKIDKDSNTNNVHNALEEKLKGSNTKILRISAKKDIGVTDLLDVIYTSANIPEIRENDVIITNARHYDSLHHASQSIGYVIEGLRNNVSGDLLSEDLRMCINYLGDIVGGTISSQETLNNIFSHFCIGK